MSNVRFPMPNSQYPMTNAQYPMLDAQCPLPMPNAAEEVTGPDGITRKSELGVRLRQIGQTATSVISVALESLGARVTRDTF